MKNDEELSAIQRSLLGIAERAPSPDHDSMAEVDALLALLVKGLDAEPLMTRRAEALHLKFAIWFGDLAMPDAGLNAKRHRAIVDEIMVFDLKTRKTSPL